MEVRLLKVGRQLKPEAQGNQAMLQSEVGRGWPSRAARIVPAGSRSYQGGGREGW